LPYTKVTSDIEFIVVGEEKFRDLNLVLLVPIENNRITFVEGKLDSCFSDLLSGFSL
jgi:hypothetical protein